MHAESGGRQKRLSIILEEKGEEESQVRQVKS